MTAAEILELAQARGVMIVTAESCTGGLLSGALTDVPGASNYLERGFVTYSNESKQEMLGVRGATLASHGAVSEQVAREMAEGALTRSRAQLAISVTGVAGPGRSGRKPEGRVCFGVANRQECWTETVEFGAIGRGAVRQASVDHALQLLAAALQS